MITTGSLRPTRRTPPTEAAALTHRGSSWPDYLAWLEPRSGNPVPAPKKLGGRAYRAMAYSKGDGVVRWQAQLVRYAECVEVTGSHVGLVFNRNSYRAIAQALAAPGLAPGLPERPVASLV